MTMPKLGESVTEGTITKWLVSPGDQVEKYEAIAEVITDKVTAEIPSSFTGEIKEIMAQENEVMAVDAVICTIVTAGSTAETPLAPVEQASVKPTTQTPVATTNKRYSPAVLRLSQDHNIDLNQLVGSGHEGRITRKDVQNAIDKGVTVTQTEPSAVVAPTVQAQPTPPAPVKPTAVAAHDTVIPVSGVRKAIATNMVRSATEIPHGWTMVEADVTNLVAFRNAVKDEFRQTEGFNLTYFAFFVKAVAQALKEVPIMNSSWQGDKIVMHQDINISIAIGANDALYVPVIRHADEKSIKGIAREVLGFAKKAQNNQLTAADMKDGTFTVNNTGSFGSIQSMGIINHPQAGILQVESIVKRPMVVNNMIGIRDMINLCLSMDHRVMDGVACGQFMQAVKRNVEHISAETTTIY